MLSLSDNNHADVVEACYSTSRYLDHLLDIDNPFFSQMISQMSEIQLNKSNPSDAEAPSVGLRLIHYKWHSFTKIYDNFNFEIVNFTFLDGDVSRSPSYGVYILQLIHFARVCSHVNNFNNKFRLFGIARVSFPPCSN